METNNILEEEEAEEEFEEEVVLVVDQCVNYVVDQVIIQLYVFIDLTSLFKEIDLSLHNNKEVSRQINMLAIKEVIVEVIKQICILILVPTLQLHLLLQIPSVMVYR